MSGTPLGSPEKYVAIRPEGQARCRSAPLGSVLPRCRAWADNCPCSRRPDRPSRRSGIRLARANPLMVAGCLESQEGPISVRIVAIPHHTLKKAAENGRLGHQPWRPQGRHHRAPIREQPYCTNPRGSGRRPVASSPRGSGSRVATLMGGSKRTTPSRSPRPSTTTR